jgi:RND family efflux transporter MFP subunit
MKTTYRIGMVLVAACAVACHEQAQVPVTKPVRPVLSAVVHSEGLDNQRFVGHVEPRYATQLGFRVGGRIVKRYVSVGDHVVQGAPIAELDPETLALALKSANAQLVAARTKFENARKTHNRQVKLAVTHATTQSKIDDTRALFDAAAAGMAEAEARLAKAREDATYAVLRAEFAGVITKIDAEAGQVVAPNTPIAELARQDALDVVADVPDVVARSVEVGAPFSVQSESDSSVTARGKLRQIGPIADSQTRTRRLWIELLDAPSDLRLGALVSTALSTPTAERIQVPAQAILEHEAHTVVWVVEGDHVAAREVKLSARTAELATVEQGLRAGERVVVAGVHSLAEGQRIKLSDEEQP